MIQPRAKTVRRINSVNRVVQAIAVGLVPPAKPRVLRGEARNRRVNAHIEVATDGGLVAHVASKAKVALQVAGDLGALAQGV